MKIEWKEKIERLKRELEEDYKNYTKSPIRKWEDRRDNVDSVLDTIFRLFGR
jgi:hypothetical protein